MLFKLSRFFLYASVFCVAIVTLGTLFPFIVGKYVFFRSAVGIALITFLLGLVFDDGAGMYTARLKQIIRTPLFWATTAFAGIFVLAGFAGVRPAFSFWSNFERGEGGLQMLTLYAFFVLLAVLFQKEKDWQKMFWMSLSSGLLMGLYGIAAGLSWSRFLGPHFGTDGYRFQGTIGNPAYVAAYILFLLFYISMIAVRGKYKGRMIGAALLAVFFLSIFYFSGTRGAFLGLVGGIVVGGFTFGIAEKRFRKWALAGAVGIALIASILIGFRQTSFVSHLPGSRIFDISLKSELSSGAQGTFSTRRIMWGIAWHGFLARPLLGWGPENFLVVFDKFFDPHYFVPAQGFGAWFDRAHSLIFDYLAETGALGLLGFLSVFASLFLSFRRAPRSLNKSEHVWHASATKGLFVALATAYLIQGLILFDVLVISMNLFLFLAFAMYMFLPENVLVTKSKEPGLGMYGIALGGGILALLGIYFGAVLPYAKATRFIQAESTKVTNVGNFEDNFNIPLQFYSPIGGEEVPKYISNDILGILPRINSSPVTHELVNFIEPYLSRDDTRHLLTLAQMHYILWHNYGDKADFAAAETDYKDAHGIGPNLPQPLYGLYQLYTDSKNAAAASEEKQAILKIWPDAFATTTGK